MLYKVVLAFNSVDEIQVKAIEQFFHVALFVVI